MVEHLLCKEGVRSSSLLVSTNSPWRRCISDHCPSWGQRPAISWTALGRRRLGANLKVEDMTENIEEKMFRRMKHVNVQSRCIP